MIRLKKVNLTLLLMASPFIIAGCGGASGGDSSTKEASASDVAVQIEFEPTKADIAISEQLQQTNLNKKAEWIPTIEESQSQKISSVEEKSNQSIAPVQIEKVISNGENDGEWKVYDTSPEGAEVTSINDPEKGTVIQVDGEGIKNGYLLGYAWSEGTSWNDTENKTIKWSMKFNEDYMIYVRVSTRKGYRYLYYTSANMNYGVAKGYDAPHYIHNGLGVASKDNTWRTFSRNLTADLKRHEADNSIISVDGFYVRGSGLIDDLELGKATGGRINEITYSDGATVKGWSVYDSSPAGTIATENGSIKLAGGALQTGYMLGSAWDASKSWNNTINKEISWDMKYDEKYIIYLSVETAQGHRFITYTPMSTTTCKRYKDTGKLPEGVYGSRVEGGQTYVHIGLCPETKNGSMQTVERNLELDLKKYEPNNAIISVNAFLVRGSGNIGKVQMFDTNSDGDYDNSTN